MSEKITYDLNRLFEPFEAHQYEWRLAQAGKSHGGVFWAKCLCYVTARAIMDRMDDVFGPLNWQTRYEFIKSGDGITGGVVCHLSVWTGTQWVTKSDGADQTDVEQFKGGLSSALKRAAVLFGIGRLLYDLDEGFATIVEKGTKGARYGQTKERETFYWLPPTLPDWALPKKKLNNSNQISNSQTNQNFGKPNAGLPSSTLTAPQKMPTQSESDLKDSVSEARKPGDIEKQKLMKVLGANRQAGWDNQALQSFLQMKYDRNNASDLDIFEFYELISIIENNTFFEATGFLPQK